MKIAVLSGKGGAGKTMVSVNLAVSAGQAVYIDCDVEEPNGRLFFQPESVTSKEVSTLLPAFDAARCNGCRRCVDVCRFNALLFLRGVPKVFPEVCHSCGGCQLVCPVDAVREVPKPVGHLECGTHGAVTVISGELTPGEASGVPVIHAALQEITDPDTTVIIDCPPGSACSVMESISVADYCILVAEPTAFGLHNFRMVQELTSLLNKPCGVVINKLDASYPPLETFCSEHQLPILARIPYRSDLADLLSHGILIVEQDPSMQTLFRSILSRIGGMLS